MNYSPLLPKREPTAYVLDERGNRVGTITHEFSSGWGEPLMRQRWNGSWVKVRLWPEDRLLPGRHRSKARHRRVRP